MLGAARAVMLGGDAGVAGGTPGATPAWNSTANVYSALTLPSVHSLTIPAHTSGNLLLIPFLARNTNQDGSASTPGGWTAFPSNPYGGAVNCRAALFWKIGNGSESSIDVTGTGGTSSDLALSAIQVFTAANGFHASPIEAITTPITGTNGTPTGPTVTPLGVNRLGVALVFYDLNDATVGSFTGESGGNWAEQANRTSSSGGGGGFSIQTTTFTGSSPISGGSIATVAGNFWNVIGFAIRPADL